MNLYDYGALQIQKWLNYLLGYLNSESLTTIRWNQIIFRENTEFTFGCWVIFGPVFCSPITHFPVFLNSAPCFFGTAFSFQQQWLRLMGTVKQLELMATRYPLIIQWTACFSCSVLKKMILQCIVILLLHRPRNNVATAFQWLYFNMHWGAVSKWNVANYFGTNIWKLTFIAVLFTDINQCPLCSLRQMNLLASRRSELTCLYWCHDSLARGNKTILGKNSPLLPSCSPSKWWLYAFNSEWSHDGCVCQQQQKKSCQLSVGSPRMLSQRLQ